MNDALFDRSGAAVSLSYMIRLRGNELLDLLGNRVGMDDLRTQARAVAAFFREAIARADEGRPAGAWGSVSRELVLRDAADFAMRLEGNMVADEDDLCDLHEIGVDMLARDHAESFYAWLQTPDGPEKARHLWPKPADTAPPPPKHSATVVELRPGARQRPSRAPNDGGAAA